MDSAESKPKQTTRPMTGEEFLASLRDGREVYIYGERVKDVTTHLAFRNTARMIARLYNALGRCYLKQNKPKDAVMAYLHTDVLFYADADAHAEALFHLSKLWSDINKSDRAVAARNTLRERYAGSVWAGLE